MSGGERILICDDDPQILRALRVILRDAGYEVVPSETGEEALDRAAVRPPQAAILDLMLPGIDGVEVCQRLRDWSDMPILVLSAVDEESEKIRALKLGADDYVTKPFAPGELLARLEALLRRAGPQADEPVLSAGDLALDVRAHQLTVAGEVVHLTPIEFALLRTLMANSGRLLTHRALLGEVWGPEYADATGLLRTHIANLRAKIEGPAHPDRTRRLIRTDSGIGYRFTG
ncbi:MAG TPA: response regulator transcription factor [Conexibacter sp.]|nr:response regulator transcription factor [Conexibacter sp.]